MSQAVRILVGDVLDQLAVLPECSVHCCVTSPPYWGLRDYGVDGQIGLEATPEEFIGKMVAVFAGVRRVLRDDGTLWLNVGDSYAGGATQQSGRRDHGVSESSRLGPDKCGIVGGTPIPSSTRHVHHGLKPKDLVMMPWRVALALQADGWYLRSVICWAKKSPMPESVVDRPTSSWEPIFLMAKSARYFYDAEAVKEPACTVGDARHERHDAASVVARPDGGSRARTGNIQAPFRNQRNVWHLGPEPYPEAHFATFPTEIPRRAIKAGTSEKGCCAKCGAPWARKVELVGGRTTGRTAERQAVAVAIGKPGGANYGGGLRMNDIAASRTTGWEPGCACGGEVVPCVVLDPFLGSGTTVAVARQLGRHGVGIEINPKYVDLARDRIGKAERPGTYRTQRAEETEAGGLFATSAAAAGAGAVAGAGVMP